MKCPVCNRSLAPTLSICLTCGAMMNDSVREELQSRVSPSGRLREERSAEISVSPKPLVLDSRPKPEQPVQRRVQTSGLAAAAKTSPTLVDFQNKNGSLPDWRLQIQNAVRQRMGNSADGVGTKADTTVQHTAVPTRPAGAADTKPAESKISIEDLGDVDPRLSAAMRRISDSRKTFLPEEPKRAGTPVSPVSNKNFPFNVVTAKPNPPAVAAPAVSRPIERPSPLMVTPLRMEKKLDTNKLPLLETVLNGSFENAQAEEAAEIPIASPVAEPSKLHTGIHEMKRIMIESGHHDEPDEVDEVEDEIEDLAPFSMRFNAGLFDLIIGVFASLLVLSPIALTGGSWFTAAGILTFAATCAIILFLYMTVSVGFFGKTLGMRLFSLELVDAEENEYPTIHQAAVSSSLYLLSMALGGLGFVSMFFNEEKRAVHDLLSGTIIVREF